MWLTRVSIDNPVFATMMMVALLVLGLFAAHRLSVDQWPEIDFPIIVVTTNYPGASPETVETDVTRPIEEAVNAIAGIKTLTSRSFEGRSVVIIEFELSVRATIAAQDVRDRVGAIRGRLRDAVKEPEIQRFNPDELPIVSLVVSSDIRSPRALTTLADQVIVKRLQNARGVGRAIIVGGVKRQIRVELQPEKLLALGLGVDQVLGAIRREHQDRPAGILTHGTGDLVVQIEGMVDEPRQLERLVVAQRGNAPVYLGQVATVVDGEEEPDSMALLDGKAALAIDIVKVQNANTVDVADAVRSQIELLRGQLPADVELKPVRDGSRSIRNSLKNVQRTMIEGGVLTVLIVLLFLGSWRSTAITGLTLPIAILGTFAALYFLGFTLNMMTLMALSLAIGILIDDAIVVRENIVRHLAMGKDHRRAALDGTEEIGLAVLATTFSIVAVFLPVAFMGGIVGRFFLQFGITVTAAVLISLFVSFTLDPMLSSVWHDRKGPPRSRALAALVALPERALGVLASLYGRLLAWSLHHRLVTVAAAFLIFVASLGMVRLVGTEFVPPADLGESQIDVQAPVGSSLDYTAAKVRQVQVALRDFPEVAYSYAVINSGVVAPGRNVAAVYVRYVDRSRRRLTPLQLAQPIRGRLAQIPGIIIGIMLPTAGGPQKLIQVSLQGRDIAELDRISQQAMARMATIAGIVDLDTSLKAAKPTLAVRLRRELASDLGVGQSQVVDALRPLLAGEEASSWKAPDGESYTVLVRLPRDLRQTRADLDRIYLTSSKLDTSGTPRLVALSQVAELVPGTGASQINRRDLQREVLISANTNGRATGDVGNDVKAALDGLKLPAGYRFVFGGSTKDIAESTGYAVSALLLAVIFIYLILASQFGRFLQPLAIMASLPMALIGVVLGLLVGGTTLNIFSAIGFIMLMGLVTKNAILLVDYSNQQRAAGLARDAALVAAARVRLRPILMTTAAMIAGMAPLALGIAEGAEQRAPMAHAVIGGLISSTLLTLVVVPVLLTFLDDLANFVRRRVAAAQPAE